MWHRKMSIESMQRDDNVAQRYYPTCIIKPIDRTYSSISVWSQNTILCSELLCASKRCNRCEKGKSEMWWTVWNMCGSSVIYRRTFFKWSVKFSCRVFIIYLRKHLLSAGYARQEFIVTNFEAWTKWAQYAKLTRFSVCNFDLSCRLNGLQFDKGRQWLFSAIKQAIRHRLLFDIRSPSRLIDFTSLTSREDENGCKLQS